MGNTPSQRPVSGGSSPTDEPTASASLLGKVTGAVRSFLGGVRTRLSVFSALDLGSAFRLDGDEAGRDADGDDRREAPPLEAAAGRTDHSSADVDGFPARDRPLSRPARDSDDSNGPDLRATEDDGRLSIYYPDREDARISSDTWQRIER